MYPLQRTDLRQSSCPTVSEKLTVRPMAHPSAPSLSHCRCRPRPSGRCCCCRRRCSPHCSPTRHRRSSSRLSKPVDCPSLRSVPDSRSLPGSIDIAIAAHVGSTTNPLQTACIYIMKYSSYSDTQVTRICHRQQLP